MKTKRNIYQLGWINNYLKLRIKKKNIKATLMFTLYWNIFEHVTCNDNFSITKLRDIIRLRNLNQTCFLEYYNYFKNRYTLNGSVTDRFNFLMFRNQNDKQYVYNCLLNQMPNNEQLISSLFLIIQRLRNNIFHGLKEIEVLEVQEPNFNVANKAIITFLEVLEN
jgi:hypothetical protein